MNPRLSAYGDEARLRGLEIEIASGQERKRVGQWTQRRTWDGERP